MTRTAKPLLQLSASPCSEALSELGESPLWDPNAGLRWLDVPGRRLFTLDAEGRETSVALYQAVTAIELGPGRDLLAVTCTGFGWLDTATGAVDETVRVVDDDAISMNDGAIDPHGRCWAGSAVRDLSGRGALYCFDGNTVTTRLQHLGMSNGLDWSVGGDELYHVDTGAGALTAWQYDPESGALGMARPLRSIPLGLPDGLTVDANGDIWLAVWGLGHVWRLDSKTGATTAVIRLPSRYPTSCVFGGANLSTLYITTATDDEGPGGGLLHAVDVPTIGRPPRRFAGDPP